MSQPPTRLSREVLRWLQSLDLAYAIRNVKRDFANGFLIAEIFSRYYDKDIQMHAFDNGSSLRVKQDNWLQLRKFFARVGLQDVVSQPQIDSIIHAETGSAILFLNTIYQRLTQRSVQAVQKRVPAEPSPAFAKPTGSSLVRDAHRSATMSEVVDDKQRESMVREQMSAHEQALQNDRMADPERFVAPIARAPSKVLRGSNRAVGSEEDSLAQITVKEVQVKHIDHNVAHLRASKANHGRTNLGASSPNAEAKGGAAGFSSEPEVRQRVFDVLDPCAAARLPRSPREAKDAEDGGKDSVSEEGATLRLVEAVREGAADDAAVAEAFSDMALQAGAVADAVLSHPAEFVKFAMVFVGVLSAAGEASAAFSAAAYALAAVGEKAVAKEPALALELFCEFALPKLRPLLIECPGKRNAVLRGLYAFAENAVPAHISAIKALQRTLDHLPTYLHALTILVFIEERFSDTLLDLYLYYCVMGMSQPSPSLRAASVAMLAVVNVHGHGLTTNLLPRLLGMAETETWWEVRAQLAVISASLLSALDAAEQPEETRAVLDIVGLVFTPTAHVSIRKIGLSYLARAIGDHAELRDRYLQVLLSLSRADLDALISSDPDALHELPVTGASGGKYRLVPLPTEWNRLAVGAAVAAFVTGNGLEALEPRHVAILAAATGTGFSEAVDAWLPVFNELRDYIFVALCDPDCCSDAVRVLRQFLLEGPEVLQESGFVGTLHLLFPADGSGERFCQRAVHDLVAEVQNLGGAHAAAVKALLQQFRRVHGPQFEASSLGELL